MVGSQQGKNSAAPVQAAIHTCDAAAGGVRAESVGGGVARTRWALAGRAPSTSSGRSISFTTMLLPIWQSISRRSSSSAVTRIRTASPAVAELPAAPTRRTGASALPSRKQSSCRRGRGGEFHGGGPAPWVLLLQYHRCLLAGPVRTSLPIFVTLPSASTAFTLALRWLLFDVTFVRLGAHRDTDLRAGLVPAVALRITSAAGSIGRIRWQCGPDVPCR